MTDQIQQIITDHRDLHDSEMQALSRIAEALAKGRPRNERLARLNARDLIHQIAITARDLDDLISKGFEPEFPLAVTAHAETLKVLCAWLHDHYQTHGWRSLLGEDGLGLEDAQLMKSVVEAALAAEGDLLIDTANWLWNQPAKQSRIDAVKGAVLKLVHGRQGRSDHGDYPITLYGETPKGGRYTIRAGDEASLLASVKQLVAAQTSAATDAQYEELRRERLMLTYRGRRQQITFQSLIAWRYGVITFDSLIEGVKIKPITTENSRRELTNQIVAQWQAHPDMTIVLSGTSPIGLDWMQPTTYAGFHDDLRGLIELLDQQQATTDLVLSSPHMQIGSYHFRLPYAALAGAVRSDQDPHDMVMKHGAPSA